MERRRFSNKFVVISCICLLFIFYTISLTGCTKKDSVPENQKLETNKEDSKEETNIENKTEENKEGTEDKTVEEKDDAVTENAKIKFTKHQLEKTVEPEFATKFINSVNNKLSAAIEGKGPDAAEEGIGRVFVKDLATSERWALEIVPGEEQNTPKSILWIDDDNVISIVGLGYGTISLGGNLYKINVKTGEVKTIYNTGTARKQVISVKKVDNKLELEVLVYDDEELIKTHTEKKSISIQ